MELLHPNTTPTVPCVLYVDADPVHRQAFSVAFRQEFKVLLASTMEEAWVQLEHSNVHVVICDHYLPGSSGSLALGNIRARYPHIRRMLVTAHADMQVILDALNHGGACFYIQEPWEVEEVRRAVRQAFAEIMRESEQAAYTERLVETNRQLEFALRQSLLI